MRIQEVECPHCKKAFPMPTKRHYLSRTQRLMGLYEGTLCGLDHRQMRLIAKEGETVNCKICILRLKKGMKLNGN